MLGHNDPEMNVNKNMDKLNINLGYIVCID
jgi:hypothetical protein